jgi:hypothetical protein
MCLQWLWCFPLTRIVTFNSPLHRCNKEGSSLRVDVVMGYAGLQDKLNEWFWRPLLQIGDTGSTSIKLSREMRVPDLLWSQFGCGQMSLLTLKCASCSQPSVTKPGNLEVPLVALNFRVSMVTAYRDRRILLPSSFHSLFLRNIYMNIQISVLFMIVCI